MRRISFFPVATLVMLTVISSLSVPETIATESSELVALHDSVLKWIELRREDEKQKADWEWQQSVLENTELALEKQIESKTHELEQFKSENAIQIEELKQLETESIRFEEALDLSATQIDAQILRFLDIGKQFPPRLAKALELSFSSLRDPELELNDRYQIFITAIGRVSQFNHLITYSEEMLEIENQPRLVAVIYWGLSRAYALDLATSDAFIGKPVEQQWRWNATPRLDVKIKDLISIFREESDPVYISLPVALE